jgi:hypothetical protein
LLSSCFFISYNLLIEGADIFWDVMDPGGTILEDLWLNNDRNSNFLSSKSCSLKASPSNYCSSKLRCSKLRAKISPEATWTSVIAGASYMKGKISGVDLLQVLEPRANRAFHPYVV